MVIDRTSPRSGAVTLCFWWCQNKQGRPRCSRHSFVGSLSVAGGTGNEAPQTSPASADARFSLLWLEARAPPPKPSVSLGERGGRSGSERKPQRVWGADRGASGSSAGRGGGRTDRGKRGDAPPLTRGATARHPHHPPQQLPSSLAVAIPWPTMTAAATAEYGATKRCQNLDTIIDTSSTIQVLKVQ